jgi:hypothetical protein
VIISFAETFVQLFWFEENVEFGVVGIGFGKFSVVGIGLFDFGG